MKIYEVSPEHYDKQIVVDGDNTIDNLFFSANQGDYFCMNFDKFFNRNDLRVFNLFELSAKRNFKNSAADILQTYNELFVVDGKLKKSVLPLFYTLLKIKSDLDITDPDAGTALQYNDFMKVMDELATCYDSILLKTISDYVEEHYTANLDATTEQMIAAKKKVNVELMITDEMGKNITKAAYLFRFFMPIVSVYFYHNKKIFARTIEMSAEEDEEGGDDAPAFEIANSQIFNKLIALACGEKEAEAIKRKLYKMVAARIAPTGFRDKEFWAVAKNTSITMDTETTDIYRKLLTNGIPKINCDSDKNMINFFSAVINNQIDFIFMNKFRYKVAVLKTNGSGGEDDDNEITSNNVYDKADVINTRKDEGSYILRQLNIERILERLAVDFGVGLSNMEVQEYAKKVRSNPVQEQIVSLMAIKYLKDSKSIKCMNAMQYSRLVLLCEKYLRLNGYENLAKIIMAKCTKHKERANICGKKMRPAILSSKLYGQLFEVKYRSFLSDIDDPIISFIGTVYGSEFTDDNGEVVVNPDVKINTIAKELIMLIKEV